MITFRVFRQTDVQNKHRFNGVYFLLALDYIFLPKLLTNTASSKQLLKYLSVIHEM